MDTHEGEQVAAHLAFGLAVIAAEQRLRMLPCFVDQTSTLTAELAVAGAFAVERAL